MDSPTWRLVSSLGFSVINGWRRTTDQDDADWTLALHSDQNPKTTVILVVDPLAPTHEQVMALNEPAQTLFGEKGHGFTGWRLWAMVTNALLTPSVPVKSQLELANTTYSFTAQSFPEQKLVVVKGTVASI